MLAFILGFLVTIGCYLTKKYEDSSTWRTDFCWEIILILSFLFAIIMCLVTPSIILKKVPYSYEIVSSNGKYYTESQDTVESKSTELYVKNGKAIERKVLNCGVDKLRYEGDTAKVDYTGYEIKRLNMFWKIMLFPANLISEYLAESTEGVMITLPESDFK